MDTANSAQFPHDDFWLALYNLLSPLAKAWVYNAHVPIWKRQESDTVSDIVQLAVTKTYIYLQGAHEQQITVFSPERLSIVIAKRCFLDLRRRDLRLVHFSYDDPVA